VSAQPLAQLVVNPPTGEGFMAHGAAADLWRYKGQEVILAGPYETGKTLASLNKVNAMCCKYPGLRVLMVRKTYRSLVESACVTFENKVLAYPPQDDRCPVRRQGGQHPQAYVYPNGSRIVLGGMDRPAKLLSSEWDVIYVNQAEELSLADWGALTGRATGRAGNMPYAQVMGDANPGPPTHWIQHRPTLKVLESRHEDNPTLFDARAGEWTDQGKTTLAILDALPGVMRLRGRYGKWVAAEGQVYDGFDRALHLVDHFDPPASWPRYWVVDFGYTNPFSWQQWVEDGDGRLYLHREIYRTRRLVEDHARDILAATKGEPLPAAIICDHDAEDRATLERYLGMRTVAAYKSVSAGIQAVATRLIVAGDKRPRLFFMRDALIERDEDLASAHKPCCALDEIDVYVWPKAADGKPNKEAPVKENDHGMDAARYMVAHADRIDLNYSGGLSDDTSVAEERELISAARRGSSWAEMADEEEAAWANIEL
jgi:phage terminase large subunit